MAERRTIAKKISVSEQVNSLSSDFARLLFTWMIPHADDYGVLSGSAWSIRSLVIPMLDHTNAEVETALTEMEAAGLLWRYTGADQKPYVQFCTWEEHQSGLHKRTAPHAPLFHDPRAAQSVPQPEAPSITPEVPGMNGNNGATSSSLSEVPGSSRKFPEVPASRARGNETKRNEEKRREPMQPTAQSVAQTSSEDGEDGETLTEASDEGADAHSHSQTEVAPSVVTSERTSAPVNPLWDTLVEVFGYSPITQPERNKWGKIVKNLKAAHATPADVRRAKQHYDQGVALGVYTWSLTPNALDTHLGELLQPPRPPTSSRSRGQPLGAAATMSRPILTADDVYPD